jgi:hypothetical protein
VWINSNVGGNVTNLATPRGLVGTSVATPTPTPTATPDCPAPKIKITADRKSIRKGESATITFFYGGSSIPCKDVTVHFHVGGRGAKPNIDYTLTGADGQDATTVGTVINGPLTLHNLYTSRVKTFPITVTLLKDKAYYLGNTTVTVQILAK